ncbi:MAG: cyclic peptide export ABC transporter [Prochloraceae cyanobacterium]|nr:cyclic peptide export ABC transporter [Prochloraceae cyanobacterium]
MNLIWLLLRESWASAIASLVTGSISGASAAGIIAIVNATLNETPLPQTLLVGGFVFLCLVQFVTRIASQILLSHLGNGISLKLRILLSQRILASSLRHLEEIGAPTLMASLTEDITSITTAIVIIPFFCGNIAIVVGCVIYLGLLSWKVLLIFLVTLFFSIFIIQFLQLKGFAALQSVRKEQDRLFAHYKTLTEGIKELKLHGDRRQAFLKEDLKLTAISLRNQQVAGEKFFAVGASVANTLLFLGVGVLLFILPSIQTVSIAIISSYVLTLIYLNNYLTGILQFLPGLSRAKIALDKIDRLGLQLEENAENPVTSTNNFNSSWQSLQLKEVTHSYRGEKEDRGFILGKINLSFTAGELVFIVGGNGSGKSTLAKLITGLYIPESGKIILDRQPINDENRDRYRDYFTAVFSDFYLFDRLLGLNDIDARAKEYLEKLQLDRKVKIVDGVLSTTDLSQGQRKRLALLTAYLEDRSIYLFDEWASDQDPIFKKTFYKELLPELKSKGKTVFVISHDDRYFEVADRIIKLDYGQVVEDRYL